MLELFTLYLQQAVQSVVLYMPRLAMALVVLIGGFKLHPAVKTSLALFFQKQAYDESLTKFLQSLMQVLYKIVVILVSISIAGIETTSIVAALGAAGFAVGLALQGSMSNFASGILILALKPIKVGGFIEVGTASGKVHKIDIFNTILLTIDNKTIIIPNSTITSTSIVNYSRKKTRRVDIRVSVDPNADIRKVKTILKTVLAAHQEYSIEDETYSSIVRVEELSETATIFALNAWCKSEDFATLKFGLIEDIKIELDKAGITTARSLTASPKK